MQGQFPLLEGDFDPNEIELLEKNIKGYLSKKAKAKKTKSSISVRILNGYFLNQYPAVTPNSERTSLYKDIVPPKMSFEEALDGVSEVLSNNYNMKIELNW